MTPALRSRPDLLGDRSIRDRRLEWLLRGGAVLVLSLAIFMLVFLALRSAPAAFQIGVAALFTDPSWNPTHGEYNLVPMLLGTILVTVGAVAVATPLALGTAIFGRFYVRGRFALLHRRVIETLAGIPSVVYGVWGLTVLVPLIAAWGPPGQSLLAGIVILALMILPTISLISDEAMGRAADDVLPGATALGLSRFTIVRRIVLPAARHGVGTAVLLGAGRAMGETMAVLMVTGNVVQVPDSFFAPMRTLTANIALEMAYASEIHRGALYMSGLVLALLVVAMVATIDRLERTGPFSARSAGSA